MADSKSSAAPAVSIIVGTYNCERFLPGLWSSIEAQTFRDVEVVVVDDASTDGTLSALAGRGDRIRLVRRTQNSNTCELPRYQGVQAARGRYCAFLDADDRWDPTFLERTVAYLEAHPEAALVHTYARIIDGEDRVQRIRHEGVIPTGADLLPALFRHCYITISAVVVRREVWLEALREEEITDFGMDLDFFIAIAKRHPIRFIPEVLASYRRSESSVSVKKWQRAPRNVNTLERLLRKGCWRGVIGRRDMVDRLIEAYAENADHWRACGWLERSQWFCRRGLRHRPWSMALWRRWLGGWRAGRGVKGTT